MSLKTEAQMAHKALKILKQSNVEAMEFINRKFFDKDYLWLEEVVEEVRALAQQPSTTADSSTTSGVSHLPPSTEVGSADILDTVKEEEDDDDKEDEDDVSAIVLLPQTPNVKRERAARVKQRSPFPIIEDDVDDVKAHKRKKNSKRNSEKAANKKSLKFKESNKENEEEEKEEEDEEEKIVHVESKRTSRKRSSYEMSEEDQSEKDSMSENESKSIKTENDSTEEETISTTVESEVVCNTQKRATRSSHSAKTQQRTSPEEDKTSSTNKRQTPSQSDEETLSKEKSKRITRQMAKAPSEDESVRRITRQSSKVNLLEAAENQGSVQTEDNRRVTRQTKVIEEERRSIRQSRRKSSLQQYKAMVSKAIKTSHAADHKKSLVESQGLDKYKTPVQNGRTFSRTTSASVVSSINSSKAISRCRSPLPMKSTLTGNSRVFLSSKSTSKLVSKTNVGTPSNIIKGLSTLLPQKPPKPTAEELKIKADEELRRKLQKEEDAIKRKEEIARQKLEEKRLLREARLKKVMENKEMLKKQHSAADITKDPKENAADKLKATRLAEAEKKRQENYARCAELRLKEEAKEKERKKLLEEQNQKQKKFDETKNLHKQLQQKQVAAQLNTTYDKHEQSPNSTYVKENNQTSSYDMTPAPEERSPEILKDEDNYDIQDLKSDDDTDDEDRPRKHIPKWAEGMAFRQAIMMQAYNPPDVDLIFDIPVMPNLSVMFPVQKKRFYKRTSSAVWDKIPMSHKF